MQYLRRRLYRPTYPGRFIPMSSLLDYNFVMNQFFIVDASTSCDRSVINPEVLLGKDLTMDLAGDEPKSAHLPYAFAGNLCRQCPGR